MGTPRSAPGRRRRPFRSFARAVSWHRRKLAVVAAVAAVLTGISAAAPTGPPTVEVVRARTQLAGGTVLGADDLTVDRVVASDVPVGVVTDPTAVVGQTLAGPVAARQMLTPLALVSAAVAVAPGHVLAPLRLADADLAAQLRAGDRVDVLAADDQAATASVVASGARVVSVPRPSSEDQTASTGALVLLDVDAAAASSLARAAVSDTFSVIWRR